MVILNKGDYVWIEPKRRSSLAPSSTSSSASSVSSPSSTSTRKNGHNQSGFSSVNSEVAFHNSNQSNNNGAIHNGFLSVGHGEIRQTNNSNHSSSSATNYNLMAMASVLIGAKVVSFDASGLVLLDDDGYEHVVRDASTLRLMHPTSIGGVDDLILLGDLDEGGMLRTLQLRYLSSTIYTYTGSILVAINPYQLLPIYTPKQIQDYRQQGAAAALGANSNLPPHIFAIANAAYENVRRLKNDQCIVISGESGAGKTESTKLVLQFLAAVSGQHSWIEQQILESNPILEGFGNAKTIRNDNSSRFGKYIDIRFNNGIIEGARIEEYLLEKSRLVTHARGERNYHIFYCMLAGMSEAERRRLGLVGKRSSPTEFAYLSRGGINEVCECRNDEADFAEIRAAMKVLSFSDDEIWSIFCLLAVILHLGNINFKERIVDHLQVSSVDDATGLGLVCQLLGVDAESLVTALTTRSIVAQGETVKTTLSKELSVDVRDAFVKGLYGRLFLWIVDKINAAVDKSRSQDRSSTNSIGVLDIFGFETFGDQNSFEQLCINFANENLQQFFIHHVFKLEQAAYADESISWARIDFVDNTDTLDLIGQSSLSVISLVDEESRFPKGTDESLLHKLVANHGKNRHFIRAKSAVTMGFGINHFAGPVFYNARGFLDKNKDSFSGDLLNLINESRSDFIKELFLGDLQAATNNEMRKRAPTLVVQFRRSLDQLMAQLNACHPFFVRCVKPNELKKPMIFERDLILRQLRYSGMMETIRIRRAGYPIRHSFFSFVERYRLLGTVGSGKNQQVLPIVSRITDFRSAALNICENVLKGEDYQIGKTKVFLKLTHDATLESALERALVSRVVEIQRRVRGFLARKRYQRMRVAAVRLQAAWRCFATRRRYLRIRLGATRLQALIRARILSMRFNLIRDFVLQLQRVGRGHLTRRTFGQRQRAAVTIQSVVRTFVARRRYQRMQIEARLKKEAEEEFKRIEAQLRRQTNNPKKAREQAESLYLQRLATMHTKIAQEQADLSKSNRLSGKSTTSINANYDTAGNVDHSKLVDELFGFVDKQSLSLSSTSSFTGEEATQKTPSSASSPSTPASTRAAVKNGEQLDYTQFTFAKFAALYFQGSASHIYQRKALKQPLLSLSSEADQLAALTVWITILRFMGDLPEPRWSPPLTEPSSASSTGSYDGHNSMNGGATSPLAVDTTPVMARIYSTLGRRYSRHDVESAAERLSMTLERTLAQSGNADNHQQAQNGHRSPNGAEPTSQLTPSSTSSSGSSGRQDLQQTAQNFKKSVRKKLISLTLRRKTKVPAELANRLVQEAKGNNSELLTADKLLPDDRPTSNLDKLHFIIGNGILRPDLRDEIYCQICKQLVDNPNRGSVARGWILISLCLGCFPPTETLMPYLRNFIANQAPQSFARYCIERMERTIANGARSQPPSWIELQATKTRRPIAVPVTFMDGSTRSAVVDSASTAREVCDQLADKIDLRDRFGFSLYVTLFDKVSSLGSGSDHIFDAVSQCEQYAKEQGAQERTAPWRLFFRKEIFTPWHNPLDDVVATNLIYQQIVRGVKFGEYRCDRDADLAMLAAQQYYIEYGSVEAFNPARMHQLIANYIPDSNLAASKRAQAVWAQAASAAYQRSYFYRERASPDQVRQDIVNYARYKWPLLFSRFYEAYRLAGPSLPKNEVILAVNWTGVYVIDDQEQVLVELSFPEIMAVSCSQTGKIHGQTINISSVAGHAYSFTSANAEDVCQLILQFLDGLKQRSKFVLALADFTPANDAQMALSPVAVAMASSSHIDPKTANKSQPQLAFKAGDLIALQSNDCGETIQNRAWAVGANRRTQRLGVFPVELVHILPTLIEPSDEIMKVFETFVLNGNGLGNYEDLTQPTPQQQTQYLQPHQPPPVGATKFGTELIADVVGRAHTLEKFAMANFRKTTNYPTTSLKRGTLSRSNKASVVNVLDSSMWRHSKEPLKAPLLAKLDGHTELAQQAVEIFSAILKFAGDASTSSGSFVVAKVRGAASAAANKFSPGNVNIIANTELTDAIFQPALNNEALVDEVYCQLVKQATENRNPASLERYWQLLWLASGLMVPSQALFREIVSFFKTNYAPENRATSLSLDCLSRINKTLRHGNRKSASHEVEVEAVQMRQLQILHRVFFPDGNSDNYEIESTTRARDLCVVIAKRLNLRSVDGFSLFVKLGDKVVSVPEADFFFDFIRHLTDLMRKNGIFVSTIGKLQMVGSEQATQRHYQVFFMRKLWTNVTPGSDVNADVVFHYPQELSKYLRGYHRLSDDECARLAALIYLSTYGEDRSYLAMIPQFLRDLVPPDALAGPRKPTEWKQSIVNIYNSFAHLTSQEAKVEFLQQLHRLPTFGSAFFEVRQSLEPSLPEVIIVAISRNGVALLHPRTKDVIRTHAFNVITNWSSGATYFHMTVGSLLRGAKLLFETNLGYKMDDLITSYISVLLTDFTNKHHRLVGPVLVNNNNNQPSKELQQDEAATKPRIVVKPSQPQLPVVTSINNSSNSLKSAA